MVFLGGVTCWLTAGQDNPTATSGDDTFLALEQGNAAGSGTTFTLGDVINGGEGNDTLNIVSDQATVNLAKATISNVEVVDVNMDAVGAPADADASDAAGTVNLNSVAYETATIEGVTGDDAVDSTDADTTAATEVDTLTVNNANLATRVVLEDITNVASTVNFAGANGNADEATVEVAGSTDDATNIQHNNLTVNSVETLNLVFSTDENDLNVVTAAAAETVNVTVEEDADTTLQGAAALAVATSLNIVADGDLTLAATADLAADAAINVSGAGDVDLATLENTEITVDAAELTGGLTVTGAANTASITSGAGDDSVTAGAIATAVNLGAGDDTFNTNSLDFGGATAVDVEAGEGTDTIIINNGTVLDAESAAHFKNFEILDVVGGQGTYDLDQYSFETVNVSGAIAADVLIDNITDETLNITGDVDTGSHAVTYELKDDSGTSDTITVNIEGVYSNAGTPNDTSDDANDVTVDELVFAGVETVTLNSGDNDSHEAGVTNTVSLLDTDATELKVTGDHTLTITAFEGDASGAATGTANTSIDTIDATGSADLVMGAGVNTANVSITGSDSADTLVVGETGGDGATGTDGTGSTVNGGAGGDTITILDDGALDTLIVDAGDSKVGYNDSDEDGVYDEGEELHDNITGFVSGEDSIDLGSFNFSGQLASALAGPSLTPAQALELVDGTTTEIADFFVDTGVQRGVAVVSGDFDNIDGTGNADDSTNDTLVFIDSDGDGSFNAANDDMIQLTGTASVALSDFGF